jgi:protoporphyrinogen oxidase
MDSFEAKAPGLHFAGNFRDGISLSDCITNGMKIADQLNHE